MMSLARRLVAEGLGTAFLLAVVIGSGIMGERLAGGNVAIALLANSLATGGGLIVLILIFGPISGAHFNPAVTLAAATQGGLPWREVLPISRSNCLGLLLEWSPSHVWRARVFCLPQSAYEQRPWSEFVATFGLLMVIGAACASSLRRSRVRWPRNHLGDWFNSSTSRCQRLRP